MLESNPKFRFLLNLTPKLLKKKFSRSIVFNKNDYFQSFKLKKKAFSLSFKKKKKIFEKRLLHLYFKNKLYKKN